MFNLCVDQLTMYIRRTKTPNSPRQSVQIVEGYRDDSGKVKQRILRHLGVFADKAEETKLVALAEELIVQIKKEREEESAQGSLFDRYDNPKRGRPCKKTIADIVPVSDVKLQDIVEERRICEGVHEIGGAVYDQMGFSSLLSRRRYNEILRDVVLHRMVEPCSKRRCAFILADKFGIEHNLDAIYHMMDKIESAIPKIKELAFSSTLSLIPNKEVSLAFFDVTTLYFESTETDSLRNFGYSKDHRFNTTQVVLALATNEDGLPLGYELFSGNTAEVSTLISAIKSWESYMKIKDVCFIADRAMFSKENLKVLDESGYRYIVAAKLKTLTQARQNQILDGNNYSPATLGSEFAWLAEFEHEGKRLITSYKSKRAHKDAKDRATILSKITKTIGEKGNTKKLISNSSIKKYTSTDGKSQTYIDETKIEQDAMWDGIHGIITNDKYINAQEAIAKYSRLWVIEAQFRINKHNLEMRPIYHWSPKRIESHIAICYMSFALLKQIEYRAQITQKISPISITDILLGVQSSILKHKRTGDLYRLPGAMKLEAIKLYRAFGIKRSTDAEIYIK